ncbi:10057_t:CDS:2, partial [Cetraspora pellucida]
MLDYYIIEFNNQVKNLIKSDHIGKKKDNSSDNLPKAAISISIDQDESKTQSSASSELPEAK